MKTLFLTVLVASLSACEATPAPTTPASPPTTAMTMGMPTNPTTTLAPLAEGRVVTAVMRLSKPDASSAPIDDVGTEVSRGGAHPRDIVGDAESLYWFDDGGLRKLTKSDGAVVTLSASPSRRSKRSRFSRSFARSPGASERASDAVRSCRIARPCA
jgi:hypothetical protein